MKDVYAEYEPLKHLAEETEATFIQMFRKMTDATYVNHILTSISIAEYEPSHLQAEESEYMFILMFENKIWYHGCIFFYCSINVFDKKTLCLKL